MVYSTFFFSSHRPRLLAPNPENTGPSLVALPRLAGMRLPGSQHACSAASGAPEDAGAVPGAPAAPSASAWEAAGVRGLAVAAVWGAVVAALEATAAAAALTGGELLPPTAPARGARVAPRRSALLPHPPLNSPPTSALLQYPPVNPPPSSSLGPEKDPVPPLTLPARRAPPSPAASDAAASSAMSPARRRGQGGTGGLH